jgi:hypothetical protein
VYSRLRCRLDRDIATVVVVTGGFRQRAQFSVQFIVVDFSFSEKGLNNS